MRPINFLLAAFLFAPPILANEHGGGGGGEAKSEAKPAEHHDEEVDSSLELKSAKQSSRDVKVPRALVTRLEKEYREYLVHNQLPPQESLKRKLLDVSVELRQKRPAALQEEVRINTPTGGGVIDLAEFVTPLRGAFQMHIKPRLDGSTDIEGLRVFYVSQAKERSIGGEDFGAGCGKFMEVTHIFTKKMASKGFELYTAEQRYISVVGGSFVMASFAKDALQVANVSFVDSRFPELLCE